MTITKAISIYCEGVVGGVLASGVNGIIVNAAASVLQAASVVIAHSFIRNFNAAGSAGVSLTLSNANGLLVIRAASSRIPVRRPMGSASSSTPAEAPGRSSTILPSTGIFSV
ncbi:hypothetical protein ACRQ5Q_13410 [Bradyrhizobium sp. PMVTL-01]|uniref:hypothetical protein n=1 Tax=Bradyrhizobium sp. PMVTL-01 TaxID=3434999 RepID=UPI003F7240BE